MPKHSLPLFLLGSVLTTAAPVSAQGMINGTVLQVLGGDNVLIEINGTPVNVDLANNVNPNGWDTAAMEALQQLLPPGTPVQIQPGWTWGETLYAYVYSPQGLVNQQMLNIGVSVPRGVPNSPMLQAAYNEAVASAQTQGSGYWGEQGYGTGAINSSFSLMGAINAAAPYSLPVGGGILGVLTVVGFGMMWNKWVQTPQRKLNRDLKALRLQLTQALTDQKRLESQKLAELSKAQDCLQLAENYLRIGQEDQARGALVQKKKHQTQADHLQHSVDEVQTQVDSVRASIVNKESQLSLQRIRSLQSS